MRLYQKLLAYGLITTSSFLGLLGGFCCIRNQAKTPDKERPDWPVYDSKSGQFVKRKRGVNEDVLNSLDDLRYRTKNVLKYYQEIENQEQSVEITSIGRVYDPYSLSTARENFQCIETTDKTDKVREKYRNLKELLTRCNRVYENTEEGSPRRAIRLHNIISEYIEPGESTPSCSVPIIELVNGRLCDCNDVSPAYFALFNYYHVDCSFLTGGVKKKGKWLGNHAWLRIKTKGHKFDFDPTWYGYFAPLDVRKKGLITYKLESKFMRQKQPKQPQQQWSPRRGKIFKRGCKRK